MRKIAAVLLVLLLCGCAAGSKGYHSISMDEAAQRMEEEEYLLVDVRTAEEYEEAHIPGAILLPLDKIETEAAQLLPDRDVRIFVYCRSGNRSKQAAEILAELGYTDIVEIGGIRDWPGEIQYGG